MQANLLLSRIQGVTQVMSTPRRPSPLLGRLLPNSPVEERKQVAAATKLQAIHRGKLSRKLVSGHRVQPGVSFILKERVQELDAVLDARIKEIRRVNVEVDIAAGAWIGSEPL